MCCLPEIGGENLGWKNRGLLGNDGDMVLDPGMESRQGHGDIDDFSLVLRLIGGVTQVNKCRGIGTTTGIGKDTFDHANAVIGGYLADADNPHTVARW
jgi:hypothetical protein